MVPRPPPGRDEWRAAPVPGAEPQLSLAPEWKQQQRLWGHSFHPMCSYLGSFPASLAHAFIGRYSRPGDVVMDPFSGRGTTALQACAERRIGVGNDVSPLATLLTAAKVDPPSWPHVSRRLQLLRIDWSRQAGVWLRRAAVPDAPALVAALFHVRTLAQLLFLREVLDRRDRTDRLLLAGLAGILHGRSDGYLTPLMPNSFSLPPGYVEATLRRSGRAPDEREVFCRLERKTRRLYREGVPAARGIALDGAARPFCAWARAALRARALPDRARLVLTSPPYLRVLRYGAHDWLRLWLVGPPADELGAPLFVADDGHGASGFAELMRGVLTGLRPALTDDAVVVIVLGDVARDRGRATQAPVRLTSLAWEEAAEPAGYLLAGTIGDPVDQRRKMTGLWGAEQGRATTIDRLLVIAPTERGVRRARAEAERPIDWQWPPRGTVSRPARPNSVAILAPDASAVPPSRPCRDGPARADEEPRPRADDESSVELHAPAAGPPVHA
jgi:hypothetical protein